MLPSFLASRSAWRRRRSFTSLPPEKNTTRLTSLSAKPSWRQCSSSLTLVVPSHLMPGLTRKSTSKASSPFGRLYKRVWNNNNMKTQTKISVYWAVVLTTLLYGFEAWVTYRSHVRLFQRLHRRCLRTILNIHWNEFITNVEVLEQAEVPNIEAILLKYKLQWAGHVSRMVCPRWSLWRTLHWQ